MNTKVTALLGLSMLGFAPAGFAQYTLALTGVGNQTVQGNVYISPYTGKIQQNSTGTTIYAGAMICDDFTTNSYIGPTWQATATAEANAGSAGSAVKFYGGGGGITFNGVRYDQQQSYNAAGWLATQLLNPGVMGTSMQNIDSFAIWNIFDNGAVNSSEGRLASSQIAAVLGAEGTAFAQHSSQTESNVTIYTPTAGNLHGINESQEFLVVTPQAAPEIDPASAGSALMLLFGGLVLLRGRRVKA